jgi:hypothetical protein
MLLTPILHRLTQQVLSDFGCEMDVKSIITPDSNYPYQYSLCNILGLMNFCGATSGFVETKRGCCGTGFFETGEACNHKTPMCENASQFLFWDCIHPSQAAYQHLAKNLEEKILPILTPDHSR